MIMQSLCEFLVPVCVAIPAYLAGCFCTGYYLFRFKTGGDIRELGSGTAGARNTGRLLGRTGFAMAFAGDLAKGAMAVAAALVMTSSPWMVSLALVAVVLGHMYPVQLGFRGGKGLATLTGALMVINVKLVLISCAFLIMAGVITKMYKMWCMIVVAVLPLVASMIIGEKGYIAGITVGALLVLFGHRKDIVMIVKSFLDNRKAEKIP